MIHENISEELLKKLDNRFLLTVAASKRSRQLQEGAHPLVDEAGVPPVLIALEEILEDKIGIRVVEAPVEVVSPVGRRFVQSVALKEEAVVEAEKPKVAEPAAKAKKKEDKEADDAEAKKKQTAKSKKKKSVVA
jgi:DNA-directed RNA polymerase subunit omega